MTIVSAPAAPPAPVRPTGPSDVVVALLVIVVELVLGWYTYDIARALARHLDPTRPVQWFYLMLPFLPLALVVAARALSPARALAATLAALGGGAVLIAYNELLRWLSTHRSVNLSYHQLQAVGYVALMAASVLAALAWGLSRRHGRGWWVGLFVAAAGTALTLWTDWTSHTGWGGTTFAFVTGDHTPLRHFALMRTVALALPIVAACVVCWLVDVAELRRPPAGPAYDEGPPPR